MLNELEQKIRQVIPELYVALGHSKPIQLNHVLEYFNIIKKEIIEKKCSKNILLHNQQHWSKIKYYVDNNWNLKTNLLSEQSEELINFLNEL